MAKESSRQVHFYLRNPSVLGPYLSPLKPVSRWFVERVMDYFFMINYNLDEEIKPVLWQDAAEIAYTLDIEAYEEEVAAAIKDRRTKDALDFCLNYLEDVRSGRIEFLSQEQENGRQGGLTRAENAKKRKEEEERLKVLAEMDVTPTDTQQAPVKPTPASQTTPALAKPAPASPAAPAPSQTTPAAPGELYKAEFTMCSLIYPQDRIKAEHFDKFRKHIRAINEGGNIKEARLEEAQRIVLACKAYVKSNKPGFDGLWFDNFFENYKYETIKAVKDMLPARVYQNEECEAVLN
jgi:hypothetical protein